MSFELDILVIGAHPDDAEIGCGGTIAHYSKKGKKIGILDLSNGEPTPFGTVEKRMAEAKEASEILHLTTRITLDMTNRYIENTIENRKKIAEVIRKYKPDILITHPQNDWHPDHVACHQLVNAAKFQAKLTKTESKYPEHYPKYFHGWGRIAYFEKNELVINDMDYRVSPRATFHTPDDNYASRYIFTKGKLAGFLFDENGEYIEGYYLVGFLTKQILKKSPKAKNCS